MLLLILYHYQLERSLGGTHQGIGCKGAMAAIMNILSFLEFLNWQLSGTSSDNIVMRSLFISLQSIEMIVQMNVLAILLTSICIPTRWLAGICQVLKSADFGVFDMGQTVDLMESTFESIAQDGSLLLDEGFMMKNLPAHSEQSGCLCWLSPMHL